MTYTTATQVLLVKHDTTFRRAIIDVLHNEGFEVTTADTPGQGTQLLAATAFDAVVAAMDNPAPGSDVSSLIREAVALYPDIVAIAIAAEASVDGAVHAMKCGAVDYLAKPFEPINVCNAIREPLTERRNAQERARAEFARQNDATGRIIGKSAAIQRVFDLVGTIAKGNSTILITGETGTGKELVAQAIHSLSSRCNEKIVSINCGAIPENLLESELFGHVKGAFTGAHQSRVGRFEQANGGTIFLDEIGNMSLSLQVKLLRVLQEREFERVGGLEKIKVDVRIIAATSANLKEMVARNEFRSDLFYRLNVIPLQMPALRERRSDIPVLATHFAAKFCKASGIETKTITQEAMKTLMNYNWPGNVRELENAIERGVAITADCMTIGASDLPEEAQKAGGNLFISEIYIPDEGIDFNTEISELERKLIVESMRKAKGNKREAAQLLQLKRTTLIEKLRRFSMLEELDSVGA
jgi:DNA-binding NtrC family response regulator